MCRSANVALIMLSKSLQLVTDRCDERYYMDYVKLHKLLFLAQCYILYRYDMPLFEEPISARKCGPYVEDMGLVTANYGFNEIRSLKTPSGAEPICIPLSISREEAVDVVLETYGAYGTKEIVSITKRTSAYAKAFQGSGSTPQFISLYDMAQTGKDLFENNA